MNEHPWMEHDKTGHRAQLPDLPYWRAQGWNPVEGPHPEPDLLHDPEDPETPSPEAGSSAVQPKPVKSAKSAPKIEEN